MAHWTQDLEELCEKVVDEIAEANKKLEKSGGNLTAGDVETLDKLTHTLKSIKTTLAMAEYDDDYSNATGNRQRERYGRNSYDGTSYARGRGRNAMRDSMGRYSRDGYSRDDAKDDMIDEIKDLMHDAPNERMKQEFKRFIDKIESM